MTKKYRLNKCLHLGLIGFMSGFYVNLFTTKTLAQQSNIIPDNTLGVESSQVINNYQGLSVEVITGGAQREINLFHSFREFNVSQGRGAYFFSPNTQIQNILTRVTGNNPSNILGILGTFGNSQPNLFLINPNGIVFGENARLDVRGSFVGTTADSVDFGEQGTFSAKNPKTPGNLRVNPSALFFNQVQANGGIINKSRAVAELDDGLPILGLKVPDGKSLLLVGGDVNIDGGRINAFGGNIELAGLSAPGKVELNFTDSNISLGIPDGVERADVYFDRAIVNVRSDNGGDIKIYARNVDLTGRSILRAGIDRGLGTPDSQGGDVVINATGDTTLSDGSFISNVLNSNAFGKVGNVSITTGSFNSINSNINVSTLGEGDAGSIFIQAKDAVSIIGTTDSFFSGGMFNIVREGAVGNGGEINIKAGSFELRDGAQLVASVRTGGRGNAGNVNIDVQDNVAISGSNIFFDIVLSTSAIFSNTSTGTTGNAGNITIKASSVELSEQAFLDVTTSGIGNGGEINIIADSLSVTNGAALFTDSFGIGNAGNVTINARDSVSFDGVANNGLPSGISTTLNSQAQGKGGDISITTDSLSMTNGAAFLTGSFGTGDAGNVTINARDIFLDSSSISSGVGSQAQGNSGEINITTGSLFVNNGSRLLAGNLGIGNAGKVTIIASDAVSFDGFRETSAWRINSTVFTAVSQGTEGVKSGDIEITTGSLFVTNGAELSTTTQGIGDGGDVKITARDTVFLDEGDITTAPLTESGEGLSARVDGNAGDIKITTNSLVSTNGSNISTNTRGNGSAGNIHVNATDSVSVSGGSVLTSGTFGDGNAGNVDITAGNTVTFDGFENNEQGVKIASGAFSGVGFRNPQFGLVEQGKGKAGDIQITTGSLFLTNGAELTTLTTGKGDTADAGNIIIRADDLVSFDGESVANTSVTSVLLFPDENTSEIEVSGNAGDIDIQARSLSVTGGAGLLTFTSGAGKAGDIRIDTTESVIISGIAPVKDGSDGNIEPQVSRLISGTGLGNFDFVPDATGEGGNIDIQTGLLKVSEGGGISARSFSVAQAGDVNINVKELELTDSGIISTRAENTGAAGNITVNATEKITISGFDSRFSIPKSGLFANSSSPEATNAGNINVNTPFMFIDNQGKISTETSSGNGGNITLQLGELLLLRNGSQITTTAGTAQAGGDGGNIDIDSPFIVAIPNEDSDITANAFTGRGGNVNIAARGIFGIESRPEPTDKSDITASSQLGIDGETNINTVDTSSIQNSFTGLSPSIDTDALIANSCIVRGNQRQENSFTITGSGALRPNRAGNVFVSNYTTGEVRGVETASRPWKKGDPIIEPQGLYRLSDGRLLLSRECSG